MTEPADAYASAVPRCYSAYSDGAIQADAASI